MFGKNYIAGEWSSGNVLFSSTSPVDGRELGTAIKSSRDDVDRAVKAARLALVEWRALEVAKRAEYVGLVSERLRQEYGQPGEATPLKQLITTEMGKRAPEADIEVVESADILEYFATHGPNYLKSKELALDASLWPTKRSVVTFEPFGVVGVIKPWNYPLEIPLWALGAALVAGNTIVFKPSEFTPLVGTRIAELFEGVGLPPGVFNLLTGDGDTGKLIVDHPDVDMISFTGSIPVGQQIAVACAHKSCRSSLELGGKDAMIVLDDANMELVVNGALWGAFANAGQVCVSVRRLLLHRSLANSVLSSLLERTQALVMGRDIGPLVSREALERVERHVADAIAKGAKVLCGGKRPAASDFRNGYFFEPTILQGTTPEMLVHNDDTFGPVLAVEEFSSESEAVSLANAVRYDLGASIWTGDTQRGLQLARGISTGMVWINDVNVAFPQAPWSGRRWSGSGVDLSEFAFYEYSHIRHFNYDTSNDVRRAWWFPYS